MKKFKATFTAPLFVLIIYILALASNVLRDKLIASENNIYLSVIILQILIFVMPAIIYCRLKGVGYSMKLNIKLFSPGKLGSVIMSALVLICGSAIIRFAQIYVGGLDTFGFTMFDQYRDVAEGGEFLFTAMAFVVMPAITEEFVFRSIILTEYNEEGLGAIPASLISALLSSMIFFSFEKLPIYFFAGIIYCMITYATGSSLTAFLTHMIFNFYGVFAERFVIKAIINPSNRIISVFTFTLLFLILSVIMFGEFEHMLRKMGRNGVPTPSYRLKKADDGKTPDITATEAEEEGKGGGAVIGKKLNLNIEALFSPTFLLCMLFFAVAIFGFM